ncbi:MAG TPA: SpvB/TcaC N-terminal domain-containing protein, partial [Actinomycetota bacterium]|nr:SpvB/TcaC N-terminal domain-containing protein [Actinomycetota bacterium]
MIFRRPRPAVRSKRPVRASRLRLIHALVLFAACLLALAACNDSTPFAVPSPFVEETAAWGGCPEPDELPAAFPADLPSTPTPAAGALEGAFSVTSTGEAKVSIPLIVSPGRVGMQPSPSIVYDSSADSGPLGHGFSIAGLSAITRCPKTIAQDGVIEPVRDRPDDALCLDGKRLIPVDPSSPQPVEFRTFPDTFVKVIADYAKGGGWDATRGPRSLRVFTKAGLIVDYGTADSLPEIASDGLVFAKGGVVRSWQMVRVSDRSGNVIAYSYRNDKDPTSGHTVEHVVSRIDYTGHALTPPSRAVVFNYSTLPAEGTRTLFSRGMALRRSLRLDTIQMFGPNSTLAREYRLAYATSPTTKRMLLQQVEECAADQVAQSKPCKPPTRFSYKHKDESGPRFSKHATTVKTPESRLGSVLMMDMTGDGLDDMVMPDANMLGGSELPITDFVVATNKSAEVTKGFFETLGVAFQEDHFDPPLPLQPEHATPIDYNADSRMDLLLHDVHGQFSNFIVLLAQPNHTFSLHNTKIPNPYPLGASPMLRLTHPDASAHLADVTGDSIADLIQCLFDGVERVWTARPWTPSGPGWSESASVVDALQGYPCDTDLHVVDVESDGKA